MAEADDSKPPAVGTFKWQQLVRGLRMPAAMNNVAGWLSTYANADGTKAHPGIGELVIATGLGRDTVTRALAALRECGLIHRAKHGGGRGSGLADRYILTVPGLDGAEFERRAADAYESAGSTRKGEPRAHTSRLSRVRKAEAEAPYESTLGTYESTEPAYESTGSTPPEPDLSLYLSQRPSGPLTTEGPSPVAAPGDDPPDPRRFAKAANRPESAEDEFSPRGDLNGSAVSGAGDGLPYDSAVRNVGAAELITCWAKNRPLDRAPEAATVHLADPAADRALCKVMRGTTSASAARRRPGAEPTCKACLNALDRLVAAGDGPDAPAARARLAARAAARRRGKVR